MSKKTFQIISLILSILALLYLILSYYEIPRYVKLHYTPTEKFLNNYKKIKGSKDKVVVCFSANDKQLGKLKPFINSLLDQSELVNDIGITIPYSDIGKIPKDVIKALSVYGYNKDYDDAETLICSVLREPEANTKIIIVDPSMIYGTSFIEEMVTASDENPDKIIYAKKNKKYGTLIKPKFFDDKVSDYVKGKGCCKWISECCKADDVIIDYSPIYKSFL